jgi:ferritin-like protein
MGSAGNALLRGIEPGRVAAELDRLYCYEQIVALWCEGVKNRLAGAASFLLGDELDEQVEASRGYAARLADRIAQLGGEVTADPTEFVRVSPVDGVAMPDDPGNPDSVLRRALSYEQVAIPHYGRLVDELQGKDVVTHRLLLKILAKKVAREDEMESALAQPPA